MNKVWLSRIKRSARRCPVTALLALFTVAALLTPGSLFALHNNPVVGEDGNLCSHCHGTSSLSGAVELNTTYINRSVRTISNMKDALGDPSGPVPNHFGCTFCHSNSANTQMKGVLNHFTVLPTRHPVGETFGGFGVARGASKNEFLTNIDGNTGVPAELECTDCHEISLLDDDGPGVGYYTYHVAPGTGGRSGNPYMLKNVTIAGEYDAFCRSCHNSTNGPNFKGTGVNITVQSHGDGTVALVETDGTPIKTGANANRKCTFCHQSHASSGKKLFVDTMDPSNGTKCVDCHQNGDANNNFEAHGHGMNTSSKGNALNFDCTNCHAVNNAHDPSNSTINGGNPKMLNATEDIATSIYGKSLRSICKNCHDAAQYTAHTGGNVNVGCLDCHDEHAEGSGTGSNRFMIPQNLPNNNGTTELSFFQSAGNTWAPTSFDYWVADGDTRKTADMGAAANAGICDNSVCHGASTPMNAQPLATFLNSANHTGGPITPAELAAGEDCNTCHSHTDTGGSWAASQSCTSCHAQPPVSSVTAAPAYGFSGIGVDEGRSPHAKHADTAAYGYGCSKCHNNWAEHNTDSDGDGSPPPTFQSVVFDAMNPTGSYTGGAFNAGDKTCNNLYCHSNGQSGAAVGNQQWMATPTTPNWATTELGCAACHAAAPTTGSHTTHVSAGAGCQNCHALTALNNTTIILANKTHVNATKDVLAGGSFASASVTFGWTGPNCSDISCHGGTGANALWGGSLSCSSCHLVAADQNDWVYPNGTTARVSSTEWLAAGHGRNSAFPSGNLLANFTGPAADPNGCLFCHDGAVAHGVGTNPFRLRNKNALSADVSAGNAYGWNDACLVCHSSADSDGFNPGAGYTARNGSDVNENHYGSKHTASTKGGTFCWDCHDPHGDVMDYMIHGGNGSAPGLGVTDVTADNYGTPASSRQVTGFLPASAGYTSDDLANASFTGLCQTCHATNATPGRASYYNRDTFTPLASHNGANAAVCTSCHTHTNGFGSACDTCHGNPPLPRPTSGTTQTWVSDNAAGTQGDHTAHNTYGITNCNATCHVVTTHAQNKTSANMGVRAATAAASTGVHKYSTIDNVDVWTGNTAGITSVVDDSCANVNCHNSTYSANAYRSAANPTYVRYWNNTFDCYSCHAYDGQADSTIRPGVQTSVTADWIASGSHDQHINRNGYALACTNCHNTTGYTAARAGAHGDGSVTFVTNYGATRAGAIAVGGAYDVDGVTGGWVPATGVVPSSPPHAYYCGNVYCHSSGEPRGTETSFQIAPYAQWNTPASGNCGTCHTVTGSVLATNVHEKHTGNTAGRYSYICQTCHNSVVNATPAIISFALHVNGTNDVSFLAAETGAAYSRTTGGTAGAAGGTCTATYCHSQGLDWSAPYTQTNNLPVTVADWDIADDGLGCGGCHGNPPSYTNNTSVTPGGVARQKKNSHTAHSGYTCNYCHNTTTTDGVTITTVANHANKVWNIAAGGGATFTPAVGNMAGDAYVITSCATISCHGGAGATWGQTLGCNSCHDTNGATVAENGGVLGGAANGTANEVDNAQWLNTGHGLAAGQYDLDAINAGGGNPAANLGCYTTDVNGGCHVTSAAHVPTTAADPFRLGATYQDNPSGICTASCHSTSATNHHNDDVVANGTTAYNFETKCIDCHDPHGDSNMFMVHNMVAADGPDADNPQAMSSIKGIPDTTKAVTFIADTAGQDFADTATPWVFTGICEVCHDETRWYRGTTTGNLQGPQAGHTYTTNCVTCHKHPSGFKGGGCDGCHGNTGTGQFWPDGVGGVPAYVDNSAGAHQVHIDAIAAARGWTTVAQKNGTCDWCHPNPGNVRQGTYTGSPEAGHDTNSVSDSRVDVIGDGRVTAGDATFYNNANPRVANVGLATYSAATQKCSAIDCHSGVLTPAWAGPAPANAAPSTYNVLANGVVDLVIAQGGTITLTADIDDSGGGTPNNVATAQWKLDATAYAAVDAFTPAASVSVQKTAISTAAWSAGDHFLYVRGSDGTLTGNPAAVKVTVTAADTVTLAATNTAPATVTQGGRVAMLRLNFTVNTTGGGVAVLDRVQLNETGTSLDADIAGVRIYNDGGGTVGTWDATDSLIGSGTLSGGTVTIDIVDQTVTNPATTTLHAIVQASSGGVVGRTVILQVDDAYITLLSPDVMAATATVNSTAATIAAPGGGACQVGAGFLVYPAAFTRSGDSGTSSYMDTTLAANIDCTLDNFCFWNDAGAAPSLINVYTGTWPGTGTTITNTGNETSFTPASGTGWVCTSGSLPILAGEYIGFYETGSVTIARFNTTGGGYIYTAGDQTPPTASWSGTQSTTAYYSFFATGSAAGGAGTIPPLTTNVQANGAASITINQGTTFNLTATVSDSSGGSHTVTQARYQRDTVPSAGAGTAMTATDGSFNSATEAVQALAVSTVGWTAGAHKVYVYGYDATDGWGPTGYATVTIIVPDVMTIALGGSLAPATADKGTTAVMLRFTAGTATGSATVNSFTVDLTGVPPTASDVVRVYLFKENEGNTVFNAAGDLPIGDVLMGSDPQVVPISATVVSTPATSFYVLYDISGSAVGGHTIGATITGAGVTAPDTVAGSAASTLTTINISGSIVCGSCHLNPPAQGAHAKHAATDVITDCDKCHGNATYQPSVAYTTSGPAIHNDGARPEMYFGRITPADNLTYAPPPGTDRCTNADCHNNTLTPPWVGGTTTCSSCHGQGANVPWPNAGAHNAHFTAFNIATLTDAAAPAICDYCHTGYGGGGGGRVGHADNNLYQVAIAATFQDQSGGAMVYGGGAAGTCTNVSCHGGKIAPAWNTTIAQTTETGCTSCHAVGPGEYNSAVSGKHAAHVAALTNPCTTCHAGTPVAGHFYNTNLVTSAMINPTTYNTTNLITYADLTPTGYSPAPSGNCTSVNQTGPCHGNTGVWDPAATGGCNFCHGYPPDGTGGSTNHLIANRVGSYASTDAEFYTAHGNCDTCHGISGNAAPPTATAFGTPVDNTAGGGDAYVVVTHHRNGTVNMNGTASEGDGLSTEYREASRNCNKSCHTLGEAFTAVKANTIQLLRLGGGSCTGCHGGATPAAGVSEGSPHSNTATGLTCEGCHTAHGAGTVVIPNYLTVGINYSSNGETGISLGGSATSGATEAEICWNCHAAVSGTATVLDGTDPSEWGLNTDTNGTAANYNFGTLTGTASWFTGTWASANFSYKTGRLINKPTTASPGLGTASGGSTHTANPSGGVYGGPTARGVDTPAQVRCSYCHDVHDTKAGSPSGAPFLRGTWKGNPYPEDGAPRSGITFNSGTTYGAVPRGTITATGSGGYQIDQNNGSPTTSGTAWTLADSAGLCGLCHGSTAPNTLSAGAVDGLDHFASAGWIGTNGHSAAVLGGGNANAFNLLTEATRRHPSSGYATATSTTDSSWRSAPWMSYKQLASGTQGYGFRGVSGFNLAPVMPASRPYAFNVFAWGTTIDNGAGAIQTNYHNFPCSKCHNPHASRLPALMITNCLDTKNNTWDDTLGQPTGTQGSAENLNTRASNWTSAQNCHRRRDPAFNKNWTGSPGTLPTQTDGWNSVTPW